MSEYPIQWSVNDAGINLGRFGPFTFTLVPNRKDYNDEGQLIMYYFVYVAVSQDSMFKSMNIPPKRPSMDLELAMEDCQFTIDMMIAEMFTWK